MGQSQDRLGGERVGDSRSLQLQNEANPRVWKYILQMKMNANLHQQLK